MNQEWRRAWFSWWGGGSYPSRDSMLSQSRSVLLLGLKRMQEKEEKDSRPRVMMDFSREAGKVTPQNIELLSWT